MLKVLTMENYVRKGFKKILVRKFYLENSKLLYDWYHDHFHDNIVEFNDDGYPCHYFFSKVTGNLIYQGRSLNIIEVDKETCLARSFEGEVFYFSIEDQKFIKFDEGVLEIHVCECDGEKVILLLTNSSEVKVLDLETLEEINIIKFNTKIHQLFDCKNEDGIFAFELANVPSVKDRFVVSTSKDFSNYCFTDSIKFDDSITFLGRKYYIVDECRLLDQNFEELYSGKKRFVTLSFSDLGKVQITKKNIRNTKETYGVYSLKENKVTNEPVYTEPIM